MMAVTLYNLSNMEADAYKHYLSPRLGQGPIAAQALVDTGSSITILPLVVFTAVGVPTINVVKSHISVNGFGNNSKETMGYIEIDLRIDPINPKNGCTTRQANKVPKEAEDMPAPVVENEFLQKLCLRQNALWHQYISRQGAHHQNSHAPNKCKRAEKLDGEAIIHSMLHARISSSNMSLRPTAQENEGICQHFTPSLPSSKNKANVVVIRREASSTDALFLKEPPKGNDWKETVRRELSKPSGEFSIKCLKEYINVTRTLYKCLPE
ncbi:hypothetical protein D8674_024359 [Pyrus ussuriensis x Pyrus communis]|uniref:Peptidase A2 domain-containing protein n=1 Tax=Pyrus ussuriensis x Pyrus communis TaxID=2448454 RepID=A0A5N5H4W8_9ROSA|nr:hypothetical protein D8674_024359 [Pyrus ussuriensis x Pyrus communis]